MTPYNNEQITISNLIQSVTLCLLMAFQLQQSEFAAAVGKATRYWLDGPGIESRSSLYLPHPYRPALEPNQPPVLGYPLSFLETKRPGPGDDRRPPSRAEVKKTIALLCLLPFRTAMACSKTNCIFRTGAPDGGSGFEGQADMNRWEDSEVPSGNSNTNNVRARRARYRAQGNINP
jgi:hypothetical protein